MSTKGWAAALASGVLLLSSGAVRAQKEERTSDERLRNSAIALRELMGAPDKGVPRDLFHKAHCIVIIPGLKKGAFIVGGEYGRGFASCRSEGGGWTAPASVRVEGGSWGLQIGGSSTDVLMLIMNEGGMHHLLGDKFTIGGDATAAIGPIGRQAAANTDVTLHAEILSWSRSRGAFAGISLDGSTLRPDNSENEKIYGPGVTNREILEGKKSVPPAGHQLVAVLDHFSHERVRTETEASNAPPADNTPLGQPIDQGEVYFDLNRSDLAPDAQQNLNAVAQTLKDHPDWKVKVVGWADTSGNKASNLILSKKRADAAKKYLVDQGVDGSRISTSARGEDTSGTDPSKERRVDIYRTNG
ncbi:MAG: YSC84-related protein [Candidatus Acidiferrales bacterium]